MEKQEFSYAAGVANGLVFSGKLSELCYFAYGADMNSRQLATRGVSPTPLSIARLPAHRLGFYGHTNIWDGGVETVSHAPGSDTWGVLYKLSSDDGEVLDGWQGVRADGGGVFFHFPAEVITPDGQRHAALLYKKDVLGPPRPPSCEQLQFILQGATERGLPADYITSLREFPAVPAAYPVPRQRNFSRNIFLRDPCASCAIA